MKYKIFVLTGYSVEGDENEINRLADDGWMIVSSYTMYEQVHIVMGRLNFE